jgi:threonine/homoserine/homoserine lactone efflux protein
VLPGFTHLGLFLSASLVLLLIPGPAVFYIVGRSMGQGRTAGLVSVLGIHAGTLVHVAAAALGLSAILAASALAFEVVKYAGAAYLIWLGIRRLSSPPAATETPELARTRHWRLFRDGFLVNLLNPKIALFFLAFLPQFTDPARGGLASQLTFLGLVFVAIGLVTDGGYALAAGTVGDRLRRNRGYLAFERYVSGALFVGLGVAAAFGAGRQE